jgi:hypothetical protein
MFIPDPGSGFFPIPDLGPDPGSRGQKSTGSQIRIIKTDKYINLKYASKVLLHPIMWAHNLSFKKIIC